ncbi:hypothetical protein [Plantactinospora sp. DSM 117369]
MYRPKWRFGVTARTATTPAVTWEHTMPHPPIVDPRFPARLRELRTARGLSLRDLARRTY